MKPNIHNNVPLMTRHGEIFLASTCIVAGEVTFAAGVNVWFGAVVRGDVAPIILGENVNIQDGAIVHCDKGTPNVLEAGVVVGHAAICHGARVGASTLVGIGAKLLTGSVIGEECLIAAGAVIAPGTVVPPRSVVMGLPGRVVRAATETEIANTKLISARYLDMARRYVAGEFASVAANT